MTATRAEIIAEARTWLRTKWHHRGNVKGAGVDCAHFVKAPYVACGVIEDFDLGYYPMDWHLHQERPRFLEVLAQYAEPVTEGLPGDVAMFKFGRHAAHGSIVVEWPLVIHAYRDERMVTLSDVRANTGLGDRFAGFWRVKGL